MPAPDAIVALVERFHEHLATYKQNSYNEEQLRIEFLNPFFKALGWDMDNEQGYAAMQFNAVVETNEAAGALWKDLGFRIIGTVPEAFESRTHGRVGLHVMHRYL